MSSLIQDVGYAVRGIRRNPGFSLTTVLTLALGIGANTAIFSLVNALMLRPLPVRDPGELVELLSNYPNDPRLNSFKWKHFEYFRAQNRVFSEITGVSYSAFDVSLSGGKVETVEGGYVVGDFFSALGVNPAIGRLIEPRDDELGSGDPAVAVLSWSYWRKRFDLDPTIVGKRITVAGVPVTVIGVTQRGFFGLQIGAKRELWIPTALEPMIHAPGRRASGELGLALIARLKEGVSLERAQAEMRVLDRWRVEDLVRTSHNQDPLLAQIRLDLEPAATGLSRLRERFGKPLTALMVIVTSLLLLACINIAGMTLARAAARRREMAVRVSLGAGRFRLIRQVLTESLCLSLLGGVASLLVAYFGADALLETVASGRRLPGAPPIEMDVPMDAAVLLFSMATVVLTTLLVGLVPALWALRTSPATPLRGGAHSTETRIGRLFGKGLVEAQVALSAVLLTAAALFTGHLSNLRYVGLGFERDDILLVTMDRSLIGYSGEKLSALYRELLQRLEAIPGVRAASIVGATPISGSAASRFIVAEGFEEHHEDRRYVMLNGVGPKYFETIGTPLVAGRTFDRQEPEKVAIVNEALAAHYFASRDPIDKIVNFEGETDSYRIVGVVGNAKYFDLRQPPPRTIYLPAFPQGRIYARNFVLRTDVSPAAVTGGVRATIGEVLADVPIEKVTTMAAQMDESIVAERLVAGLSTLFATLATSLAAVGLYGLLSYFVTRRRSEIGLRIALGAAPHQVTRMIVRDALGMVLAGLVLGLPLAIWGDRFAANVFEKLPATSWNAFLGAGAAMLLVAVVASYLPGRRAARVDPMTALRYE